MSETANYGLQKIVVREYGRAREARLVDGGQFATPQACEVGDFARALSAQMPTVPILVRYHDRTITMQAGYRHPGYDIDESVAPTPADDVLNPPPSEEDLLRQTRLWREVRVDLLGNYDATEAQVDAAMESSINSLRLNHKAGAYPFYAASQIAEAAGFTYHGRVYDKAAAQESEEGLGD